MFHKSISWSLIFALVLAARHSSAFALQTGLDTTFGGTGKVITDFSGLRDAANAAVLQPDGKIIVAGTSFTGMDDDFALARYNPDGSLDLSFGMGGKVHTDISNDYLININTASAAVLETLPGVGPVIAQHIVEYRNTHGPFQAIEGIQAVLGIGPLLFNQIGNLITVGTDSGYAVAIQVDGKIIVAGESSRNFALVRYHPNGALDTSFGQNGKVVVDIAGESDYAFAVAIQPDGKIVVSGRSDLFLALARFNSDGSPDTSFDTDGKLTFDFGGGENYGGFLALQPDGRIILAGQTFVLNVGYVFALARFLPEGSLDFGFGQGGMVLTDLDNSFDDAISAVILQHDGRILVVGSSELFEAANVVVALARYNSDGSLDTTFGTDGSVMTDLAVNKQDIGNSVALQANGQIVVAGRTGTSYLSADNDFVVLRYSKDGNLDPAFGMDGKYITDFGYGRDIANALLIQPDGKIILAGEAFNGVDDDFALARYEVPLVIEVRIDIKPGNTVNPLNPKSAGTIPVGILSTIDFNASFMVDRNSLTFGRTGNEASLAFCNQRAIDINYDGLPDLLCHFKTGLAGFQKGDAAGILHGQSIDAVPITGQDAIKIIQ